MTKVELTKMLLIYQYLYMTDNPNNVSQEVRKKLKNKLRWILTHQEDLYEEAKALKKKVYKEAYDSLFVTGEPTYISLGLFMTKIYNSIEKQKLVGHKLMKRAFDSYYHAHSDEDLTDEEILDMSQNAENLASKVLELLGDKKPEKLSKLARMRYTHEQNMIIEKG